MSSRKIFNRICYVDDEVFFFYFAHQDKHSGGESTDLEVDLTLRGESGVDQVQADVEVGEGVEELGQRRGGVAGAVVHPTE